MTVPGLNMASWDLVLLCRIVCWVEARVFPVDGGGDCSPYCPCSIWLLVATEIVVLECSMVEVWSSVVSCISKPVEFLMNSFTAEWNAFSSVIHAGGNGGRSTDAELRVRSLCWNPGFSASRGSGC